MFNKFKDLKLIFFFIINVFNIHLLLSSELKLLVLIIDSDDQECYKDLREVWRSYMHKDKEHVEAYFIRGNPNLNIDYELIGDTIWSKTEESLRPGILNKTLLSLEFMSPRLDEFDYILRTNLSSFYVFDRLLKDLENKPREQFIYGSFIYFYQYYLPSGCGYIMSKDVAKILLEGKNTIFNDLNPDDITTGWFLLNKSINLTVHSRIDIWNLERWNQLGNYIPADAFQFRIKNLSSELRVTDEVLIANQLLKMFYSS